MDGAAQSIIASHDILVTPCREADDIHDTAALRGQKHLSIMHPHEKTWKQTYTLEVFGHTCLLYIYIYIYIYIYYIYIYMYMAYIFSSLYHMTMPILDLRWHKRISRTFFGGPRKRAEKIALSYPSE